MEPDSGPEVGPPVEGQPAGRPEPLNIFAIAAPIVGAVGIGLAFVPSAKYVGVGFGVVALVLGGIGLGRQPLRPVAAAGVVTGIVPLVLLLVLNPSGQTLTGTLSAPECGGGYDIENAAVTVKDQSGSTVGASSTGLGDIDLLGGRVHCVVEFTVDGVGDAEFYEITVGTHGGPSYSREELKSFDWHVELSLSG